MLVMTLTGLLLWSSDLALRYFPKWLTDVATAVHFYEAVLAALAIAIWHLYWVVFDPEVYPMDWSWWNGQAPASRVRERADADGGDGES
jgi:cytochrome b subunit of formate dehydrogenase